MNGLETARKIANCASALDWLKNSGSEEQRAEASAHLEILHDIAQELAGNGIEQINPHEEPTL